MHLAEFNRTLNLSLHFHHFLKTKNSGKIFPQPTPFMHTFNISKRLKTGTKQFKNLKGSEQLELV